MSEYVYDKNKPGRTAGAGDNSGSGNAGSGDAGSGLTTSARPGAQQNRNPGSDAGWENDDWSMRSSSVSDEDDPLIKLARLMEQNERNFEAAAQRTDAPVDTFASEPESASQYQQTQAYQPEPQMADPNLSPEPVYQHAPQEAGYAPTTDFAGQGDSRYAASDVAVAEAPVSNQSLPPVFDDQTDDQQYDPFAPGGSSQPLPERDFDVSRIPRAIRPAVSVEQSERGGLHGSASPDQTDAEYAQQQPPVVARQPQAAAPRPPVAPMDEPGTAQPDPIAAELQRYVDANDLAESKRANTAPQPQAAAAVQPASELAAAPAAQPDFSYLREVEDLRVPPRQAENEPAEDLDMSAQDTAQPSAPLTEEADVLYDGYEDDEGGGLFASRGMMVAAGVMAFVLLGGGALLAYQAIFSSDDDGPPPLVLADKNPVRMLPDGQSADTSGAVDIPLTNEGDFANGVIQPGAETPIARINPNIDPDRTVRQIGVDGNGSQSEGIAPRSVRTFKVNPDGSIVAEPANTAGNTSNAIQPRTVTTQQVSGNGQIAPAATAQSASGAPIPRARPGGTVAAPAGPSGGTALQPRVASNNTATSPSGRADLPVAPRVSVGNNAPTFNQNAPSVQPSANSATASVPPASVAPAAPAAQPAAPAAVGDFVVQVSSQRSEEAARSAFAGLQRRFPTVLGNQTPDIARADLGSRGVFYRVRVGPMETRVAAANFCESLKNAGGDCIVARR